ncbi:hypothetical protein J4456_01850 [Candidatus Pacearchaeota archaeon]|nr:hypothetical protein [Candidatus Pacearchaeota archaeon]
MTPDSQRIIGTLEEFAQGNIFDEEELIVQRLRNKIVTLRKLSDEKEIRICRYDLRGEEGKTIVIYTGYSEVFKGDQHYDEFEKRLKEAALFR